MTTYRLSPTVDRGRYPNLRSFLEWGIDMQLGDIRDLLRLPCPGAGLEHGQNFTAAAALANFIAGASVWLFEASEEGLRDRRDRGRRYHDVVMAYWPWEGEAVDKDIGIDVLYSYARNPLAHAFGMPDPEDGILIALAKEPLLEEQLVELDRSESRPDWLGATVRPAPRAAPNRAFYISVPAWYWGVQRMTRALLSDDAQSSAAENLAGLLVKLLAAPDSSWRRQAP